MLSLHLQRLCQSHHSLRLTGFLYRHLKPSFMALNVSRCANTGNQRIRQAKWIIQRDKKVFTLKSIQRDGISKEFPVWLLKIHGFLMSNNSSFHPGGPVAYDFNSDDSSELRDLMADVWKIHRSNADIKRLTHKLIRQMDSLSLEQIILIADVFCLKKVWIPVYCHNMINFVSEMAEMLTFTPSQLARLAFHMMCQGGASPEFTMLLEKKTLECIHDLTLNEIAVICTSFFNCQTRIKSLELLNEISVKLLEELGSLNFLYLSIYMKTFRYSNFIKISFYHKLGDLLIEKDYLSQFNSLSQVMHVAFTYASLRTTHPPLFSYILRTCAQSPGYKFRMKDVSKVIWSCGTLLVNKPKDLENIHQMVDIARANISHSEMTEYPDNLVDLCMGLCFLNIYPDFLINLVFSKECVPSLMRLNTGREKFYQLNFLHQSVQIEHPGYAHNRLDDDTKNAISSGVGEFPLHLEFSQKKGLKKGLIALQELLGSDKVGFRRILPHFQASDIIVVWDKAKSSFVKESLVDKASSRYIKLAIIITSFMHSTYDGKPLGLLHTRLRQLRTLGYEIVQVTPEEAFSLEHGDLRESKNLLHDKLSHALKLS